MIVAKLTVDFFANYVAQQRHQPTTGESDLAHSIVFALLLFTATVVFGSVAGAFRRGDTRQLLITVFVSYFSLMLVFASVYYEAAFFGDLGDAIFKYESYRSDALNHIDGPRYETRRAFAGIEPRFWSGVDWPVRAGKFPGGLPPGAYQLTVSQMREIAATHPIEDVIQFVPEARLEIFADCLHLSVITMTTVGYGDITPRSLVARVGTDSEAVSNTLLLIFGVGVILGIKRSPATQPAEETPKTQ